jgi:hypothetical protein
MFTPEQRARLRSDLLEYAAGDPRVSGAAITGSAAVEREDRWSDIDLAFGVVDASEVANVLSDWTALMYEQHLALHHLDVKAGAWIYRVFLLPSTLQVDLALVPAQELPSLRADISSRVRNGEGTPACSPPSLGDNVGLGSTGFRRGDVAIRRISRAADGRRRTQASFPDCG